MLERGILCFFVFLQTIAHHTVGSCRVMCHVVSCLGCVLSCLLGMSCKVFLVLSCLCQNSDKTTHPLATSILTRQDTSQAILSEGDGPEIKLL